MIKWFSIRCQDHSMGKRQFFHQWYEGNWISVYQKITLDTYLILYIKIKSKWIKELNVRPETTRISNENKGWKLKDTGVANDLLALMLKTGQRKKIIDELDFLIIKNIHASKDTSKETQRQPMKQKEIFVNHIIW